MTNPVTDKELADIEERYNNAINGFPRDKLTFYSHAYRDIPRLLAALRLARKQAAEPLRQADPPLSSARVKVVEELPYFPW